MTSSKRPRILIVDDDDLLRRTLVRMLAARYDVTQAENGAEAIEILQARPFDAVLTDLEMPEVGGDGVVAWIEHNRPAMALRVVVMTGGAKSAEQTAWLRRFDPRRVLPKPSVALAIVEAIDSVLNGGAE